MGNNQNTTARVASGDLAQLDPTTIVIDTNVRTDTALDKGFVASIAERGVILPLVATRDADGTIRVRDGQRRTLAAREAGLDSIPVYVIGTDAEGDDATVERVTDQLIANEHRTDLSNKERAQAAQTLIDLGVSRTRVAKATSLGTTKAVDAAVATAKSTVAMSSLDAGLTLEQAAIIAGYEDAADTDAVRALCDAAAEGRFDHKAAELAATAAERAAYREAVAPILADGYEVLDQRPWGYRGDEPVALGGLVRIETGESVTDDDRETMTRECVVAFLDVEIDEAWIDANGERVDESLIDWALQDDPDTDATPDEGMLDPRTLTEGEVVNGVNVSWYHRDPARDGLESLVTRRQRERNADRARAAAEEVGAVTETGEVDHAALEAAQAENERAERRRVLKLNKLALAAQEVRREKLAEVLGRKTLPKGASATVSRFVASTMWRHHDLFGIARADVDSQKIAVELLGGDPIEAQADASAERAQVIVAAIVCAAHEANLPKDAWRGGHEYLRMVAVSRVAYLEFLTEVFGYQLSDVEKVITGEITAASINLDS